MGLNYRVHRHRAAVVWFITSSIYSRAKLHRGHRGGSTACSSVEWQN